jgi:hypothetical protein
VERADQPRATDPGAAESGRGATGPGESGALLASDVLVLMAAAGVRMREVTAAGDGPAPAAPGPVRASPAGAPPAPVLPIAPIARARDGVLVAPGWGRRAPPPLR